MDYCGCTDTFTNNPFHPARAGDFKKPKGRAPAE